MFLKIVSFLRKNITIELIALIMSFFAIWATYQQNKINREFYELSVKPLLKRINVYNAEEAGILIENFGLGVAIIEDVQIKYKGDEVSQIQMLDTLAIVNSDANFLKLHQAVVSGSIKPNENLILFKIIKNSEEKLKDFEAYKKILHQVEITIKYRDLYNNAASITLSLID